MEEVTFSFEKLKLYQVARALVKEIYVLQNSFPKEEKYALGDQVRRAATSITANLAEGSGRQSVKEKIHFIEIAFGSMTEVFCEPTIEARAEISLLNLCLARRRKTKSTADSLRSAIYKRRAARCLTSPVHRSSQDALWFKKQTSTTT